MVSYADNPNTLFLEPFIKWIREVYQGHVSLLIYKRLTNNGKTGSYCVLTDTGKKGKDLPIKVFVKLKRIGISSISFEIYDTFYKKFISFEANSDTFDFRYRAIDQKTAELVQNYKEAPYDHSQVLENSMSANSSPTPSSPTTPQSGSATSSVSLATEITDTDESEVVLLKKELERSTCEIILLTLEKEALLKKIINPNEKGFDLSQFKVVRPITHSLGIDTYLVESSLSGQKFNLKEVILTRSTSDKRKLELQQELETLLEINESRKTSPYISHIVEKSYDITSIRRSYYILADPGIMNLEEFSFTYVKQIESVVPVILTQITEGLAFLAKNFKRVHGNLNMQSILVDAQWRIKLTGLEMSYKIGEKKDPLRLITGENDLLYKHPYIFELIEQKKQIEIGYSLDRWSVGCLAYKLIFKTELFIKSPSHHTHPGVIQTILTQNYGKLVASFLTDYRLATEPSEYLESELFSRFRGQTIAKYLPQLNQAQSPQPSQEPQQPQPTPPPQPAQPSELPY